MWYCTQKGYKPWLEPNKQNTRTNEQGGHTTWYDEQELLKVRAGVQVLAPLAISYLSFALLVADLCRRTLTV